MYPYYLSFFGVILFFVLIVVYYNGKLKQARSFIKIYKIAELETGSWRRSLLLRDDEPENKHYYAMIRNGRGQERIVCSLDEIPLNFYVLITPDTKKKIIQEFKI